MAHQDNWEKQWQDAFDNRSVDPPTDVWDNIASNLDDKGSKRNMLVIWLAAASISVFAATGVIYMDSRDKGELTNKSNIAQADGRDINSDNDQGNLADGSSDDKNEKAGKKGLQAENSGKKSSGQRIGESSSDNTSDYVSSTLNFNKGDGDQLTGKEDESPSSMASRFMDEVIPKFLNGVKLVAEDMELPEVGQIWGVPVATNSYKKQEESNGWYAGLDISTGSSAFGGSSDEAANMEFAPTQDANSVGAFNYNSSAISSTSMGVTFGRRVADRVILETGLSYMRMQNDGGSNLSIVSQSNAVTEAFNDNADLASRNIRTTQFYELENVHQFVSIPLKAGYMLLDKKWKMSVSSGVSGDYFFRTFTEPLSGNLQRYEATPSQSDQWNDFTLSVLGEMSFSRKLGESYNIAITPQIRRPITDFSNTSAELQPLIFQLGL